MKQIDYSKISNIFEKGDYEIYSKENIQSLFNDKRVIFGTVVRSILNYELLKQSQKNKFKEQFEEIEPKIKLKYYSKYYSLLSSIGKPTIDSISPTVSDIGYEKVLQSLSTLLEYFIAIELYENCTLIYEYTSFIETNYLVDR